MQKKCWSCKVFFEFKKEDILIKTHTEKIEKITNRKPIVRKHFLQETEYSGIETYLLSEYLVDGKNIICPACGAENTLRSPRSRHILKGTSEHQRIIDENDMFGPNHPCVCGEQNAIDGWIHRGGL